MKKLFFALTLSTLAFTGFSQRDQTLFDSNGRVGFFGGPIWEFHDFDNNVQTSTGGGLALILGDAFIGGYGVGEIDFDDLIDNNEGQIELAHGGIWVGYVPLQYRAIHPYSSLKIGWGAVGIEFDDEDFDADDGVFVLSPEIGAEVNVFRWFRVAAAVNYRWVDGADDSFDYTNSDFRDWGATLTLRFGLFGKDRNRFWENRD